MVEDTAVIIKRVISKTSHQVKVTYKIVITVILLREVFREVVLSVVAAVALAAVVLDGAKTLRMPIH